MRMPRPIRHRLLTVAALGLFTAALAALALYRVIAFSTAQRLERAREAVAEELAGIDRVGAGEDGSERDGPGAEPDPAVAPPAMIGMRAGVGSRPAAIAARAPASWRAALARAAERAARARGPIDFESPIPGATLVGRVRPALGEPAGPGAPRLAWVALAVKPSAYGQSWRLLVVALTISALLLVASAAYALVTVKRGAGGLQAALRALASDLNAAVPRPPIHELSEIADGIATLARHLAESRQIQERLGRDLARQERLVALGRVVAGVAHEVRNPLASIKLRLDLAMTGDAPLPPSVADAIAHASSEITRLDRLVADLLIVSGRALGPRQTLDIGGLLRARAGALAPWSGLRRVTIETAGAGGTLAVDGDALARAIDNLLRNAVEASPDGGTVAVTVADEGPQLRIRVEDDGPGVAAARAGELFEPFFTTKAEGTGLGLAISRAIARAHGGDVLYGREGGHTRFELTLLRDGSRRADAESGA
jgi:signal transduction histidine kinase